MAKPEGALTTEIRKAILEAWPGSVLWKIHGGAMQYAGIPDLIGCVNGHFVGIEVKLPGKEDTLTERQRSALRSIEKAGGIAVMATAPRDAVEFFYFRGVGMRHD